MPKFLLFVACRDLKFDDGSSAKISIIRAASGEEEDIGKTERLVGETPVFEKYFEFECTQPDDDILKVSILDDNDESRGVATYTISKIQEHERNLGVLTMSAERGTVVVHIAEKDEGGSLKLTLRGKDLKNIEGYTRLRKSDPFYTLSRPDGAEWKTVYASLVEMNNLDPEWPVCEIPVEILCNADFDLPLKLEVFDQENDHKHETMGSVETSVNILLKASGTDTCMRLMAGSEDMGDLLVTKAELEGCTDNIKLAKNFMAAVSVALETRSSANDRSEQTEQLRKNARAAKEAAEAAQLAAEVAAKQLEEAEASLAEATLAAEAAERAVGGISCES